MIARLRPWARQRSGNSLACLLGRCALVLAIAGATGSRSSAADWPTYRHDVTRSGITSESLAWPLAECWTFQARHAPRPAWGDPKPGPVEDILELRRVHFDDAFQIVGGNGALYFGSSADHKAYCLDLATGAVRWTKSTGGPIRLAPTLSDGRVYVGSDDGYIYCWDAAQGGEIWRFRAAPEDRRLLGHGKLISLWPSRTSVLVDGGVAYFGAGIFPAEGVFLYGVDASSGKLLWRNDSTGENPQSRVSPQGYLVASPTTLYAPMGRVSPAAFRRADGQLVYETSFGKTVGGSYALLAGDHIYTGTEELVAFDQQSRDRFALFPGRRLIVGEDVYYLATGTELMALDRKQRSQLWKVPCPAADELILAGSVLIAGGADEVTAFEAQTGASLWHAGVDGAAKGLAVVDGRLLVSTDRGQITCFGPSAASRHGRRTQDAVQEPFAESPYRAMLAEAAETILATAGVRDGYCLVLGCETGQLAWELAQHSNLMVYVVAEDAEKADTVRQAIDATGMLGARICVEHIPAERLPYADYFANLIVSETAVVQGTLPRYAAEAARLLKPQGGVLMIGQPTNRAADVPELRDDTVRRWREAWTTAPAEVVRSQGAWLLSRRGPLAGAGNWTHQYGNPENTACSDDQRVKIPLGLLWFGSPGPGDMVNRHSRAAAPVSLDGRMFVQGENVIMAYDIYNGVQLWTRELAGAMRPNASHDSSNLSVGRHGLFVGVGPRCLQLDCATGETRAEFPVPASTGKAQRWGYVATAGERLYGSRAAATGVSDAVVAYDAGTREQAWIFESPGIAHNSITISDGSMFLVASPTAEEKQEVLGAEQQRVQQLPEAERKAAAETLAKTDVRAVVAVDLASGQLRWRRALDFTQCGPNVSAMCHQGVLVLFGVYLDGHYWKEFFAGQFAGRRIIALSAPDGSTLWSQPLGYRVRPLIVGDTLHVEPWALELRTGKHRQRINPITEQEENWQFARPGHHCGCPSASPNCLFFRSWNLGYYDLVGDYGTMHFGGQRPGCWINFMATGGLVVMPEASTGCMCDFPNMGTVAFQPTDQQKAWAWYSTSGPALPVKQLALNLGAPGDRRDSTGKLWLAYPRPSGSLVLSSRAEATFHTGGGFVRENSVYSPAAGTEDPWLFASTANGLKKLVVPLLAAGDGRATYRVRLGFLEPLESPTGRRVFDVQLQGRTVAEGLDIAHETGAAHRVVWKEFAGIEVHEALSVELAARQAAPDASAWPLLHAVEVEREQILGPGCTLPDFLLNDAEPTKTGDVVLVNLGDGAFQGQLILETPPSIRIEPSAMRLDLPAGSRNTLPLRATVQAGLQPGIHPIAVRLLRDDGAVELERSLQLEYLGGLTRVVFPVSEDTHVTQRYPDRNFGSASALLVDGGDQKMGDGHHSTALLKFVVQLPAKPVSVRLRIVNAGNPTGDAGRLCLAEGTWQEAKLTYANRPQIGRELAKLGRLAENQVLELQLPADSIQNGELTLAIDPTSTDGVDFLARESGTPPQLVVEY